MKIIFLDIDGVVNTSGDKDLINNIFEVNKLIRVIKLSNITLAKIIVISDRRIYEDERKVISKVFYDYKINLEYLSFTRTHRKRSDEINYYLSKHNGITNFVILDDCDLGYSDDNNLKNNYINTEKFGFSDMEFINALELLTIGEKK